MRVYVSKGLTFNMLTLFNADGIKNPELWFLGLDELPAVYSLLSVHF